MKITTHFVVQVDLIAINHPQKNTINVNTDFMNNHEMVGELKSLVDMGTLGGVPTTVIDQYISRFLYGTEGQRMNIINEFLYDVMGRSGGFAYGRKKALDISADLNLKVLVAPSVDEVVSGKLTFSRLRNVDVIDILGRDLINLSTKQLKTDISNTVYKSVVLELVLEHVPKERANTYPQRLKSSGFVREGLHFSKNSRIFKK